mgnify:CR=1 FL=1
MYVNQVEKKKKVKETSAKYEGIVRWIREQIEAEELQPGERIESEYQLCDRFGVSRQTVRHAIAVLEKEGMRSAVMDAVRACIAKTRKL